MGKGIATMVVIGDRPEAQRVRTGLLALGAQVVEPEDAYRLDRYAAIFFTDEPLARLSRHGIIRTRRLCRIRQTATEFEESGVTNIPPCISAAQGIVLFSAGAMNERLPRNPDCLPSALREVVRVCTRFQNQRVNAAFQGAALTRKSRRLLRHLLPT